MRKLLIASVAIAAVAVGGCQVQDNASGPGTAAEIPSADWPAFVNGFIEASFKANPGFAVYQGRHEYDGEIADLSQPGIDAEVARLKKAITDAQAFSKAKLNKEQQYERDYLVAVAKAQLFWIDPEGADQRGGVRAQPVAGQGAAVVEALAQEGWEVTQSSISRDIATLGLVKVAGAYRKPDPGAASSEDPDERRIGPEEVDLVALDPDAALHAGPRFPAPKLEGPEP